jgi:tRNA (cytosine38-C5)-methyltransferase
MQNELRVLEFYSGIGGFHCALLSSPRARQKNCRVVQAFDLNTNANRVYEQNFPHSPPVNKVCWLFFLFKSVLSVAVVVIVVSITFIFFVCHSHIFWNFLQKTIESLNCSEMDKFEAEMWMLSPPCQPYTRIGNLFPNIFFLPLTGTN